VDLLKGLDVGCLLSNWMGVVHCLGKAGVKELAGTEIGRIHQNLAVDSA